jgi:hypothetical protein
MSIASSLKKKWLAGSLALTIMVPALPAQADGLFSDIDAQTNSWAGNSINVMAQKQILTGYPDGTFKPGQTISKAEWTKMVYGLFDKYRPNLTAAGLQKINGFGDVPPQHWAFKQISEIYDHTFNWGVYGLTSSGQLTFQPDLQLTRVQLADMLYPFFETRLIDRRLLPNDVCNVVSGFKDIPFKLYNDKNQYEDASKADNRSDSSGSVLSEKNEPLPILFMGTSESDCSFGTDAFSNAQASSLASLQASGIMTMDDSGNFRPIDKVTRAEAVTILNRIYNYLKKSYWLADYSTIDLESAGGPAAGTGAGASGNSGSGSGGFSYNPDSNLYTPDPGLGDASSGGYSNQSIVNVQDYFNDKGELSKNLTQKGEIEAGVMPKDNKFLTIDLKSIDKVDLVLILDGKLAFLKQEELPITISVDGVNLVGLRTQQRKSSAFRQGGNTATLSVKLDKEEPPKPGKKK